MCLLGGERIALRAEIQFAAGSLFQMSTAHRQFPSGSRRQTVTARPLIVTGFPSDPGMVTELVLSR